MNFLNIQKFMLKNGRLSLLAKLILTSTGVGVIYLSLVASPNILVLMLGLSLGFLLVSMVTYSNKAESLDLPAPFTNDPLGWREAKKSYGTKKDADKSPKKGD
jgi:hypothetical protein